MDPKELADQHWNYIEALLRVHCLNDLVVKQIGFHYCTEFVHGWKHAMEHAKEIEPLPFTEKVKWFNGTDDSLRKQKTENKIDPKFDLGGY